MKYAYLITALLLGSLLLLGGIAHYRTPEISDGFIPSFLPKPAIHYLIGALELILAIGIFIPKYRQKAALFALILMLAFLPIHIIDAFRDNPIIGSHKAAYIRIPFQLLFIGMAFSLWKNYRRI
jgi:uncharacterized membrane protein